VAKALWVWTGSVEAGSGLVDVILGLVIDFYRRNAINEKLFQGCLL
jgi:hypothetical protein